ncbi:MAG: hypothetical protein AAF628_20170 [Planctomycetota bacterium]
MMADRNAPAAWRSARTAWHALLALLLLSLAVHTAAPVTTNDLYWHLATGRRIVAEGFPAHDAFSYTATELPWFLHEWLTQVTFYTLHLGAGFGGLRLATGLAAAGIGLLVYRLWRREVGSASGAVLGTVGFLFLAVDRFQTRPTLFSMALVVLLVALLTRRARRWTRAEAAAVVGLTLLWVNLHSVGLLALPLYGCAALGVTIARLRGGATTGDLVRHVGTLALVALATLVTPSGLALWAFALQDKREVMQFVSDEWAPFDFDWARNESLTFDAYVLVLLGLAVLGVVYVCSAVAIARARAQGRLDDVLHPARLGVLALCVALALAARRFHWMLAIAVALGLGEVRAWRAAGLLSWPVDGARLFRVARGGVIGLTLLASVAFYARGLRGEDGRPHEALVAAHYWRADACRAFDLGGLRFLADAGLQGNVFCHYGSGGHITFAAWPKLRVFIDSRIDLYRRAVYLDWLAIARGRPDQQALLDRWGTDLYYRHWDMVPPLDAASWECVYRGDDGEVYVRNVADSDRPHTVRAVARPR